MPYRTIHERLTRPALLRYALALLIFVLALGLRFAVLPVEARLPYTLFYPATALAFWLCGVGPGLLVVVLSALTGFYIFTPPVWSWEITLPGILSVVSYVVSSLLVAWVVMAQRAAADHYATSEKRLDAIVNTQSDIVCRFDVQGRVLFANEACQRLFGPMALDLHRTSWSSIVWPEDLPAVQQQIRRLSPTLPMVRTENRIRLASGAWRWAEFTNTGIFDAEGRLREVQSVGRDTTERKALERQLQEAGERMQDLYDNAPCGYYSLDARGRYLQINDTGLAWLGCTRDEVVGKLGPRDFFTPEGAALFEASFPRFMSEGKIGPIEFDIVSRNGVVRRISTQATALRDDKGEFLMSRSVMYDVTELARVRHELESANREQAAMLNSDLIGIAKARDRTTVWANKELARMFHYRPEEIIGQPTRLLYLDDASHQAFGQAAYEVLRQGDSYRGQLQMARKGGEPIWVDISGTQLSGDTGETMWMMLDITEMKHHEARIEKQASSDPLTGLPNRLLLADRLRQGILHSERLRNHLAVCFIDLDGFKVVNDDYGHDAGDHLLRVVAARLQTCVRGNDTVARLGGDEFVLLLANLQQRDECRLILERALAVVSEPVPLPGGAEARVSASIGIALCPDNGRTADQLMADADAAMYRAKRAGRNRMHFC